MPINLQLAKPVEGKEGAKLFIEFFESSFISHQLKLHQDAKGTWWPELAISLRNCEHKDIQELRLLLAVTLEEAAKIIRSEDFKDLKTMAKMISI